MLTRNDVQQVIQQRWRTPLALPEQGVLLPKARHNWLMICSQAA
ncbi:MAG: hypothetical protein M5U34_41310 [Chloroflexi bacterium]|nr:hypothetical protein [Chloroflexota bacterium]